MADKQGIFVGRAAVLAVALAVIVAAVPAGAADSPADTFQATPGQWAGLKIGPVGRAQFRAEYDTDGQITFNDDASTPVYSPFSGRVVAVLAHAGDTLAKGAPLYTIDASEMVQARDDLASALAGVASAQAALIQAQAAETRQHALLDAEGAALKDWQQAQVDLATAQAARTTAQATLDAVRGRLRVLGLTAAEITALEKRPHGTAAAGDDGGVVVVRAPVAGVVTQRQLAVGQYVNSAANNGTPVFTIADLSTVWLVANARERDAAALAPGMAVEASVAAWPGRVFKGRLAFVAPAIDPNTRRLAVRAVLDNADGALKPQMYADVALVAGAPVTAPAVPDTAIVYEGDQARVWVADPATHAIALRRVTVGRRDPTGLMEIVDGLKVGEQVVLRGALFIDRAVKGD